MTQIHRELAGREKQRIRKLVAYRYLQAVRQAVPG